MALESAAGCPRMIVLANGNVGIGTTSPQTLFTVSGANQALGGAFNTYGNVLITSNEGPAINRGGSFSLGGRYWTGNTTIATFGRIHGKKEDASDGSTAGYLSFETTREDGALLFERMRITSTGNVGIGTTNTSTEANLFLGAQGTVEGGQLVLQKGTSCNCATHLDNYQDLFRIMSGTNTGSTTVNMSINHANGAATFSSSVTAGGRVIGTGFKNYSGEISIASGAASTIYTMGDNGLYTVQIIAAGGSLIYSAAAIFYAHHSNSQYIKTLDLYDGANVTLDNSGNLIRITNQGFTTLTWNWSIIFQAF
jgi:hypothetical protein